MNEEGKSHPNPFQINKGLKKNIPSSQWLFLVPLKGGRWHIVPIGSIYHLYTTYILPSGGLSAAYHLLGEPETTIDQAVTVSSPQGHFDLFQKVT